MKILFIVNMRENAKGGLFYATHNRIKTLVDNFDDIEVKIYSLVKYDNWFLKLLKTILNKRILRRYPNETFEFEGIIYKYIYYKDTITRKIFKRFGIDHHLKDVVKEIDCEKVDIISAHWGDPQGSLAYYLSKECKNTPYTLTLHGSDVHTAPFNSRGAKKILMRNLKYSKANFFVSNGLMETVKSLGVDCSSKSFVSHNAINHKLFFPISRDEIELFKKSKKLNNDIVGFVGDLKKIKRADKLISIFKRIQSNHHHKITFLIIGDGELKQQLIEESLKSNLDIRLLGRLPQYKLRFYYNVMDCMILPSKNEGLGNVVLEAQACGTPVIATDVGGISEIISNREYLVKNDEDSIIDQIPKKVINILKNKNRNVVKGDTWLNIVKRELDIINSI